MSFKYPFNAIYIWQVSIHDKPKNLDVIIVSEMWLKNDKHLPEYLTGPGYEFAYWNRDEKRGGGVAIYIRDAREFKVYNGISKLDDQLNIWG